MSALRVCNSQREQKPKGFQACKAGTTELDLTGPTQQVEKTGPLGGSSRFGEFRHPLLLSQQMELRRVHTTQNDELSIASLPKSLIGDREFEDPVGVKDM